jgi:hypothetical protein
VEPSLYLFYLTMVVTIQAMENEKRGPDLKTPCHFGGCAWVTGNPEVMPHDGLSTTLAQKLAWGKRSFV